MTKPVASAWNWKNEKLFYLDLELFGKFDVFFNGFWIQAPVSCFV
jgi:hypothetical protein